MLQYKLDDQGGPQPPKLWKEDKPLPKSEEEKEKEKQSEPKSSH